MFWGRLHFRLRGCKTLQKEKTLHWKSKKWCEQAWLARWWKNNMTVDFHCAVTHHLHHASCISWSFLSFLFISNDDTWCTELSRLASQSWLYTHKFLLYKDTLSHICWLNPRLPSAEILVWELQLIWAVIAHTLFAAKFLGAMMSVFGCRLQMTPFQFQYVPVDHYDRKIWPYMNILKLVMLT